MNSLQDLVTNALPPEKEEVLSSLEILESTSALAPLQIADKIRAGLKKIEKDPPTLTDVTKELVLWTIQSAGRSSVLYKMSQSRFAVPLLLRAEDPNEASAVCQELAALEEDLRKEAERSRRDAAVGSFSAALDLLQSVVGDDLLDVVQKLTGAKKPTVQRWIRGGSASWSNSSRIMSVARTIYTLEEECDWDSARIRSWMETPLPSGRTPLEIWSDRHYHSLVEIKEEIERIQKS